MSIILYHRELTFSSKYCILNIRKGDRPVADIISLITNLGFPIGVCLMLMWYIKDLSAKHLTETKEFTEALNQNTLVLQKLCDTLGIERETK